MPKRKPRTGALAVMAAGERVMRAERKVTDAEKSLARAVKARTDASVEYMALIRENLPEHTPEAPAAQEGAPSHA